ncbi:uncharacterized protein LOC121176752 isoform X1 [Toxotes jaculatrix]|uniref:uncharacterized protein LOC121176752 isoform X1 n=1 Tax=Toxotes jaculatrix TaxID=941984 RepID=UPI001B3AF89D|nr:uncharacterized protein LOC121176752 isoform X1 [Toxotes jaculatrix]XP_040886744.1 uncharacterized protein LOC121176752 isoform X1 [Toxotes jaculatrix]
MSVRAAGFPLMVTVMLFCCALGVGPFTVSVAQDVYQAEERSNVTLTWLFPVEADMSARSLYIDVTCVTVSRRVYLFDSSYGTDVYPDQLYEGRVRCNAELAWKGRIECVFTDLRLNDTGTYQSIVVVDKHSSHKSCNLSVTATSIQPVHETSKPEGRAGAFVETEGSHNASDFGVRSDDRGHLSVTAAADSPRPHRPTVNPLPDSRQKLDIYGRLGLVGILAAAALLIKLWFFSRAEGDTESHLPQSGTPIRAFRVFGV